MYTPIPTVDVYQSKTDEHEIVLLHHGPGYVMRKERQSYIGNLTVGSFEKYSRDSFSRLGLSLVLKSLADFPQRKRTDRELCSELELMTSKQRRNFAASHRAVVIGPAPDGRLRLGPMRHKVVGVSGMGVPGGERYVSPDATPEEFMRVLQECFDLAD